MKTSFPSDFLNSFRLPSYNNGFFVLCEILVITFATQSYVEFCFTINLHCLQKHLSFDFCAPQMRDQTLPVPPKKRQTILSRVIINSTASLTISSNFSHGLLRLMFVLRFGQKRKQINYCLVLRWWGWGWWWPLPPPPPPLRQQRRQNATISISARLSVSQLFS